MIDYFDLKLERSLLRAIISISGVLKEIYEDISFGSAVFADRTNKTIFIGLIKYYQKRGTSPTKDILKHFIIKYLSKSNIMTKAQQIEKYKILIDKLYERRSTDAERKQLNQIKEELINLKKGRILQETIIKASDYLDEGDVNTAEKFFAEFKIDLSSAADIADEGDYILDWAKRLKIMKMKREHPDMFAAIPTGIAGWNPNDPFTKSNSTGLDIFLDGGHYNGELTLVIGDSGAGKSFELMEFAYNAALSGKNVAYFSIEMNKWKIQTRLDARISGIAFRKFRKATLKKEEVKKWKNKMALFHNNKKYGRIFTVGFYKGCTVASMETKARDIEQIHGMPIDMMVIDYLNDIKAIGNFTNNEWSGQGQISWNLKELAGSWNRGKGIPVITANQGKSTSSLSKFKTMSNGMVFFKHMKWNDAAFSPRPSQHASVIIGLLHSKGDENNIGTMVNHQIIKNRDGETNLGVVSFPNFGICRLNSEAYYRKARKNYNILRNKFKSEIDDL